MSSLVVWKYQVHPYPFQLMLPQGAKVLDVQVQGVQPQLWVLVDQHRPILEARRFVVVGTGHRIYDAPDLETLHHVGTFQQEGGGLVWHLFEVRP